MQVIPQESTEEQDKRKHKLSKNLLVILLPHSAVSAEDKNHMTQMEELVQQQCDMELMKAAMLKHEETFRQQVHDLHRLYRIQRQLMSDLTRRPSTVLLPCQQGQRRRQHPRRSELNLQLPVDEHIFFGGAGTGRQVTPPSRRSEDELELTLAVNGGSSRSQRRRRDCTPAATDTDGSLLQTPSSSTDSNGALHRRATARDLREGMVAKQPQWLVQCLSLRMA